MQTAYNMEHIYRRGACGGGSRHELFFSDRPDDLSAAQEICAGCDVQMDCLGSALERGEEWGVWGGVIFWDGEALYRKRGRGRPPKSDVGRPLEADRSELWQLVKSA